MFTFPVDSVKTLVGGLGPRQWVFASVPPVDERTDLARQVADRGVADLGLLVGGVVVHHQVQLLGRVGAGPSPII